jgi:cytoskeletal protein RodZ
MRKRKRNMMTKVIAVLCAVVLTASAGVAYVGASIASASTDAPAETTQNDSAASQPTNQQEDTALDMSLDTFMAEDEHIVDDSAVEPEANENVVEPENVDIADAPDFNEPSAPAETEPVDPEPEPEPEPESEPEPDVVDDNKKDKCDHFWRREYEPGEDEDQLIDSCLHCGDWKVVERIPH